MNPRLGLKLTPTAADHRVVPGICKAILPDLKVPTIVGLDLRERLPAELPDVVQT